MATNPDTKISEWIDTKTNAELAIEFRKFLLWAMKDPSLSLAKKKDLINLIPQHCSVQLPAEVLTTLRQLEGELEEYQKSK